MYTLAASTYDRPKSEVEKDLPCMHIYIYMHIYIVNIHIYICAGRLKSEVEKDLPPKREIKLLIGMSEMQRTWCPVRSHW